MATFILLVNFTVQGIRAAQDSPKRADTFKAMAKKSGVNVKDVVADPGTLRYRGNH